ncbi:hypothetical protein JNUCC42_23330 (plasmid) [Brevibacterium sp. JNUCC-42]|nr:hypothetical protein JNUCC42_23330 [Brevibacterium sp. JNUCC-42]
MNKIASKLMIGALALAVFAPTAAFAATNANVDETKVEQSSHKKYGFLSFEDRQSNQEELMKIINKYNPDLADDFQKLFEEVKAVKVEVDEAMVKKLDEIDEQVKNGTLTQEQAKEKRNVIIDEAKVEVDEATKKELEETKKKLDEINEQVKNGTLTQEQANKKFEELGVFSTFASTLEEVAVKVKVDEAMVKKLDEIDEQVKNGTLTQEQAKEKRNVIIDEAKVEVDEATKKELEETKKKLDEINEQVKNGTLTQEQANEKFEELGVFFGEAESVKVEVDEATKEKLDIIEQIKVAADADDADTVNKLLQELLEKMQNEKQPTKATE